MSYLSPPWVKNRYNLGDSGGVYGAELSSLESYKLLPKVLWDTPQWTYKMQQIVSVILGMRQQTVAFVTQSRVTTIMWLFCFWNILSF